MNAISRMLGRCDEMLRARRLAPSVLLRWAAVALLTLYITAAGLAEGDTRQHPIRLEHDPRFILEAVAREMNVALRPDEPTPEILLESTTPLTRFQAAIAEQWGFRPQVFSNAYAARSNEIYLTDDPAYYGRLKRTLDESLAHELAHYIQVRYLNADLAEESLENDAVAIQGWFSAAYAKTAGEGQGRRR
jgi:hypothetical protein